MKKILSLFFRYVLCLPIAIGMTSSIAFCQAFQRTYGTTSTQTGTCVQHTQDGNYIVSGMTSGIGAGYNDMILMKTTTSGNLTWTKTFGGTGNDYAYYVTACADGGYILSGSTASFGAGGAADLYLVRTDSDGNLLWSQTVGGSATDIGWFVMEMSDGGFITCGQTNSYSGPSYNGYLVKHDSGGNLLWTKVLYGSNSEYFYGMSKTSDGGLIITGATGSNSFGSSDAWLVKTDSNGDTLWTRQYGKITEDAGWAVIQTNDGGYAITGDMHKDTVTPGAHNMLLLKTNSAGTLQWANLYGSNPGSEVGYDIIQNADSGYSLLGNTGYYGSGSKEIIMINADKTGATNWSRTYGYLMQDDAWQFRKTGDGGYVIIAATENYFANNVWDIYMIKTDSMGIDSCFEGTDTVETFVPFLQTRSGIAMTTGGTAGTSTTIETTVTLQVSNPCALVGIDETVFSGTESVVYPNPFSTEATLAVNSLFMKGAKGNVFFILYDIFGKELRRESISNPDSFIIHRRNLTTGIYFYKVESSGETVATGKLVVSNKPNH